MNVKNLKNNNQNKLRKLESTAKSHMEKFKFNP
jgi:hypothetical protein